MLAALAVISAGAVAKVGDNQPPLEISGTSWKIGLWAYALTREVRLNSTTLMGVYSPESACFFLSLQIRPSNVRNTAMKKNNLVIYLVLLVVAYVYFSGTLFQEERQPVVSNTGEEGIYSREPKVGSAPVIDNAIQNLSPGTQAVGTNPDSDNVPNDIKQAANKPESNNPQDLPPDLKAQLEAPPPELPEDLKRQLEMGPQELPEDLKAQLAAPPPPLPDDIANALKIPPRVVTIDEVNTPPEAREDEEGL